MFHVLTLLASDPCFVGFEGELRPERDLQIDAQIELHNHYDLRECEELPGVLM
jgi:hypothetical protein